MTSKKNKLKTYIFAFLKGLSKSGNKGSGTIFLLFFGRIGDAVMFLDVLNAYKELYVKKQNKKLILGCRNEVWALLKSVDITSDIGFFEIHREDLYKSFAYFKDRVYQANKIKPEAVLHIRENHVIENAYVHSISSNKKIIYRVYPIEHKSPWNRYFSEHTYTDDISGPDEVDYLTSQAYLIRKLGLDDYKSVIPLLPKKQLANLPEEKTYVCMCPGASVANKCWPTDRYSKVINFIHSHTSYSVVICGGKAEQEITNQILGGVYNKDRVLDYTGNSTMDEWIALIQGSAFVVCNESASVHLAACSQVEAICIGEQKFSDKWLPYRPEILREKDRIPNIIRCSKLPCAFCAKRNFELSDECRKCFENHGVIKCVYEVSVEDVINAVAKYIS